MAQTTAKAKASKAKAAKAPAARTSKTSDTHRRVELKTAVNRTAELSEEVLSSVESGQRAALAAVRRFVDTVDEAMPAVGDRPSRRETVIDAALDMADKLVTTQYEFLRSVVRSAEHTMKASEHTKK